MTVSSEEICNTLHQNEIYDTVEVAFGTLLYCGCAFGAPTALLISFESFDAAAFLASATRCVLASDTTDVWQGCLWTLSCFVSCNQMRQRRDGVGDGIGMG